MQVVTTDLLLNNSVSEVQLPKDTTISQTFPSVSFQEMMDFAKNSEINPEETVSSYSEQSNIAKEKSDVEDKKTNETHESVKNEKEDSDKAEVSQIKGTEEEKSEAENEKIEDKKIKDNKSESKIQFTKKTLDFEEVNVLSFTGDAAKSLQNVKEEKSDKLEKITSKAGAGDKKKAGEGLIQSKLDKAGKITVTDLRTQKVTETANTKKAESKLNFDVKYNGGNTATINMNFLAQNAENNMMSLNTQVSASDGSNFQAMLNNQIQENIPEFVKTGNLILKDNDQGTINLILHPEDLGNVKIHLSLDGKTISGHIIVATKEALEVFKDNAQTLREAFEQNGFDNASFNVSYNDNGSGYGQNSGENYNSNDFAARQAYDFSGETSGVEEPLFVNNSEKNSEHSINIVA